MDEEPTNNSNGIVDPVEPVDPVQPEATAPIPADASPAAGEAAPGTTAKPSTPLTSEKVLDIALGVAVIAGEALDKAAQRFSERAKELQEQAPAFWDTAEERGRPIREQLISTLKGAGTTVTAGDHAAGEATAPDAASGGLADSLRNLGREIGISVGGGNARLSAEDEIRSLEDRVRELEQVVVSGKTGVEPELPELSESPELPDASETSEAAASHEIVQTEAPLSESATEVASPAQITDSTPEAGYPRTTAETYSYAYGEDQHEDILAASPYAVSETDDEQAIEASGSVDLVEAIPQGDATPPADDVTPPDTAPPASGRSSRKKQRDFDPEATDENAPTSSPEA